MISMRPFGKYPSANASNVSPRPDLEDRFYIERSAMDALCLVEFQYGWLEGEDSSGLPDGENWSVTPWLVYARDPFIVNSSIKCKKISRIISSRLDSDGLYSGSGSEPLLSCCCIC